MDFHIGVIGFFAVTALIASVVTIMGKCPAGVATLFLTIAFIISVFPKG